VAQIVILEDDADLSGLLTLSLSSAGHNVVVHVSAAAAQAYIESHPVDLVVSDLIIKKDGVSSSDGGVLLTHRVKTFAKERGLVIPVIAITGAGADFSRDLFLQAAEVVGADVVLEKPFAPDDLLATVEELLRAVPSR